MPGLAASPKIFENISLPKDRFVLHFLEWKIPSSVHETLENYAFRMSEEITRKNPVLLGVSFGGVLVQEISKIISVKKIILISSIKSSHEFPLQLKLIQISKIYKLFPTKIIENLDAYTKYFLGDFLKKKALLYKMYLSVNDAEYLNWAIYTMLHWQQEVPPKHCLHIHGDEDQVFPLKYISGCIRVNKGTHTMILLKGKQISKMISESMP